MYFYFYSTAEPELSGIVLNCPESYSLNSVGLHIFISHRPNYVICIFCINTFMYLFILDLFIDIS